MRQFEGLSDFFRNATDEEKKEVYLEVIEKAKEIKDGTMSLVQHELHM